MSTKPRDLLILLKRMKKARNLNKNKRKKYKTKRTTCRRNILFKNMKKYCQVHHKHNNIALVPKQLMATKRYNARAQDFVPISEEYNSRFVSCKPLDVETKRSNKAVLGS